MERNLAAGRLGKARTERRITFRAAGTSAATEPLNCGGCDNCLAPRATWDGTLAAQKFLSCVYRIREKSGFGVGIQHVVEVLCGADTEKIRKFGHHTLSTYDIGSEHTRAEWGAIGRELVRLGLLFQNAEKFNIVELTDAGRAALKSRQKITLTKPVAPTGTGQTSRRGNRLRRGVV